MNKKQKHDQVINLITGKLVSLSTLYTDRTEVGEPSHKSEVKEPIWKDYCDDKEFINYYINLMKKI
jgi:hypothetical protein